jgi:tetratricopeptide (TPR) repeat protein
MSTDLADPMAGLQMAVAAHRAGRLDEAERLYRTVLATEPDDPNALHLLGVVYRQRGRPQEAAALIAQALQRAPALADAHANLANAYSDMHRFDAAADSYGTALLLGGGGSDTQSRLIVALQAAAAGHRAAGRMAEARACLHRAYDEAPERLDLIQELLPLCLDDDLLDALMLAVRAWRLVPNDVSFRTVWDLANRAGQDVRQAQSFVAAAPRDPFRLVALGNALRRARRGWEAEAAYHAAIAQAPELPFPALRLACLMLEQGRHEAAERLLRQVEQSDPGRVRAMHFGSLHFRRLRRRALPPPPEGFAPYPSTADLVVFAACDGGYFERFAGALLNSVQRNAGITCQFHLHVINPPADLWARVDAYKAALGDPAIAVSTEWLDVETWTEETRRTWFACARFRLLPHLMEAYAAPILMLDADLLVLRDLTGLLAAASEGDIAVVATEQHRCEPWNWFWADVTYFNATASALACADLIARYIEQQLQDGRAHWFLDQIALSACLLAGYHDQPEPVLVRLPPDIHRLQLVCAEGVDEPPGPAVLFWSAHASTVDTALTLAMPRYQDYVLPWPPRGSTGGRDAGTCDSSGVHEAGSHEMADADGTSMPDEPVGADEMPYHGEAAHLGKAADPAVTAGAEGAAGHAAAILIEPDTDATNPEADATNQEEAVDISVAPVIVLPSRPGVAGGRPEAAPAEYATAE